MFTSLLFVVQVLLGVLKCESPLVERSSLAYPYVDRWMLGTRVIEEECINGGEGIVCDWEDCLECESAGGVG